MRPLGQPFPKTALQLVKNFRQGQLNSLEKNLRTFGPFPEPVPNANGVTPVASLPNPFLPIKNPKTGKWREPKISLRRQAELVKKAYATGTLDLLPSGPKKAAFEHRLQRLAAASKSPLDLLADAQKRLEAAKAQEPQPSKPLEWRSYTRLLEEISELQAEIPTLQDELVILEGRTNQDEAAAARKLETSEMKTGRVQRLLQRRQLERTISEKEGLLVALQKDAAQRVQMGWEDDAVHPRGPSAVVAEEGTFDAAKWDTPVHWVGEYKAKKVAGSDLGTRLYSGKKRMFKLHLFERRRAKIVAKRAILMRDMAQRIQRYKQYHKKRKPHPLKPSFYTKPPKLPF